MTVLLRMKRINRRRFSASASGTKQPPPRVQRQPEQPGPASRFHPVPPPDYGTVGHVPWCCVLVISRASSVAAHHMRRVVSRPKAAVQVVVLFAGASSRPRVKLAFTPPAGIPAPAGFLPSDEFANTSFAHSTISEPSLPYFSGSARTIAAHV